LRYIRLKRKNEVCLFFQQSMVEGTSSGNCVPPSFNNSVIDPSLGPHDAVPE